MNGDNLLPRCWMKYGDPSCENSGDLIDEGDVILMTISGPGGSRNLFLNMRETKNVIDWLSAWLEKKKGS